MGTFCDFAKALQGMCHLRCAAHRCTSCHCKDLIVYTKTLRHVKAHTKAGHILYANFHSSFVLSLTLSPHRSVNGFQLPRYYDNFQAGLTKYHKLLTQSSKRTSSCSWYLPNKRCLKFTLDQYQSKQIHGKCLTPRTCKGKKAAIVNQQQARLA